MLVSNIFKYIYIPGALKSMTGLLCVRFERLNGVPEVLLTAEHIYLALFMCSAVRKKNRGTGYILYYISCVDLVIFMHR